MAWEAITPKERLAMASTIHPKYWSYQPPMPVRRVWVPKPRTNERRPLTILPMIDRCKQALVKVVMAKQGCCKVGNAMDVGEHGGGKPTLQ